MTFNPKKVDRAEETVILVNFGRQTADTVIHAKLWRRIAQRTKGHISLIFVSSDSKVREIRMSRLWYWLCAGFTVVLLVGVGVVLGLQMPAGVGVSKEPLAGQLETSNRKTEQLALELSEMKQVAESIRHLAGVREFEATAPAPVTEYTTVIDADSIAAEETVLALGETRLPFLMRERLAPPEEKNIGERQETLFRSTPFIWPVRGWVTREFLSAGDPIVRPHAGMDIAAREGTPVMAAGDGIVVFSDWDQDLGWLVVIEHGYGFTSRYGHNSSLRVEKGNRIKRGQIVALVGNTGRSSAPHLHYEVWKDGVPVDPRKYLPEVIQWNDLQGAG